MISDTELREIVPPRKTIPAFKKFVPLIFGADKENFSLITEKKIPKIKLIAACPITKDSDIKKANKK